MAVREVPPEYLCPITHEILRDPVVAGDGHTYERESIERWFKSGRSNLRSPVTNELLSSVEVVPNILLRNLIVGYCTGLGNELLERHQTVSLEELDSYIEAGADVNVKGTAGDSLLMVFINSRRMDIVNALLKHNPDVLAVNDAGDTAITILQGVQGVPGSVELSERLFALAASQKQAKTKSKQQTDQEREDYRREQAHRAAQQQGGFFGSIFFPFAFNGTATFQNFSSTPAVNEPEDFRGQLALSRTLLGVGVVLLVLLVTYPM